jgi:hypothetical protein
MTRTFYFNTGVRPENNPHLMEGEAWRGGVKQIPFDCEDVPEGAELMFLCDDPNLREAKYPNVIVRPVSNTKMISRYAYFKVYRPLS